MEEKTIYEGSPSQWINIKVFLLCGLFCWLIVPIFFALYHYYLLKCTKTTITTKRIIVERGLFSKRTDEILLKRVTDTKLFEPFLLRLVGLSNLTIYSTDKTRGELFVDAIHNGKQIWNELRAAVEMERVGVKEFEQRFV
ncbi:MAG: PH domain-containing protein [Bacteroidales bacterium]|nr:PH domain-containing protein [Bacteroidales bacterium]